MVRGPAQLKVALKEQAPVVRVAFDVDVFDARVEVEVAELLVKIVAIFRAEG